jgi:hypothetical protein
MYTLEFTLKQHSPIIHFQYFLSDATLRSTELKSALDKFIIGERLKCWSCDQTERLKMVIADEKFNKWLKHSVKPSNPSFDYDIELIVLAPSIKKILQVSELKNYGFFGNQPNEDSFKDEEKFKKAVIETGLIKLTIKSPYIELLGEIDKIIAKFFLLKNFGTRQSKGFGCFYPIEKHEYLQTQKNLPYYFDYNRDNIEYKKIVHEQKTLKHYELFEVIKLFYNTLRSGINIPNHNQTDSVFYFKSLMWAYAKSKNEHWDKKAIKNEYKLGSDAGEDTKWKGKSTAYKSDPNNFPLGYKDSKSKKDERHIWRDILGLSSLENAGGWKLSKDHNGNEHKITRFKSPIIFKPFKVNENQYRVFFGVDPTLNSQFKIGAKNNSEAEILGKQFNVKFHGNGNLKLKYPVSFDYSDYLKFAINTYNSTPNWIENTYHVSNEFHIIDSIYKQLKLQVI